MTAILQITDGTETVDLIALGAGFHLQAWKPATPDYKGGGTFQDSPLANGRRLVTRQFANAIEQFSLKANAVSQDALIRETQALRRLLEKAADYWSTDWQDEPVYLVARASRETNTRYAIIHTGRLVSDDNPFAAPFLQAGCLAALDDLALLIERGHWLAQAPGTRACVQASATQVVTTSAWSVNTTTPTGNILALLQTANGDLYAGTDDTAKIYRSTDDGSTWALLTTLGADATDAVNALAQTPYLPYFNPANAIHAGVSGNASKQGVWRSTDGGSTWSRGDSAGDVYALRAGRHTGRLHAGVWDGTNGSVRQYDGESWSDETGTLGASKVHAISDEQNGYDRGFYSVFGQDGELWLKALGVDEILVSNLPTGTIRSLLFTASGRLLAGSDDGKLYKSDFDINAGIIAGDAGTWALLSSVFTSGVYALVQDADGTIYAGDNGKVWRSTDDGATWTTETNLPSGSVQALLVADNGAVYAGDNEQIARNTNTTATLGRAATCDDEVFVANSRRDGHISALKVYESATAADYAAEVLADSPVGYWRLGEASGTTAADASGNNLDGTYYDGVTLGATGLITGDSDTAVDFDGVDGRVGVPQNALLDITGALTLECWIKTSTLTNNDGGLMSKGEDGDKYFGFRVYEMGILDNTLYFQIRNAASTTALVSVDVSAYIDGARHHVVCTWDGTTNANGMKIYIDGTLVAQATSTINAIRTVSSVFDIGGFGQDPFDGVIDEAAVYDSALSSTRISAHYDAGTGATVGAATYSDITLGGSLPVNLLPTTPAAGDIFYAGADDPFCSLVFDIDTPMSISGTTIVWEYYNGSWTALTVQDGTAKSGVAFGQIGVGSVHWVQPSDWTTVAVDGTTAYWVRARVTAVGSAPTAPTQQNRDIYTIVLPYAEVAAAQAPGDLPALLELAWHNRSDLDGPGGSGPDLYANRVIVGLRSYDRGPNFTAYLNAGDEQNPVGVTVTAGTNTTFGDDTTTPTGRRATYNPAATEAMATRLTWTLATTIARDFYGTFHVFLRARQSGGSAGDISVRLQVVSGSGGVTFTSETQTFATTNDWQIIDFGRVTLPASSLLRSADLGDQTSLAIQASATSGTPDLYLYDLVLIPIDEWAGDFVDQGNTSDSAIENGRVLDVDSVRFPKRSIRALARQAGTDYVIAAYQPITNGAAILQANARQRLWFLAARTASAGSTDWRSEPWAAGSVQLWRAARYLSARGDR